MTVHHMQPSPQPCQEYQEDIPPLSNVLNVPVGQEDPAGQEIATLLTSKLDHEVDVVNEQDPDQVVVEQVGHVPAGQQIVTLLTSKQDREVDVVKVEQAPDERLKIDVATELAGKDDHVEVVCNPASNLDWTRSCKACY